MSRLDYITILIVTICVAAIIFLVYKMTDIFQDKSTPPEIITPAIEVLEEPIEKIDKDIYDYDVQENIDSIANIEEETPAKIEQEELDQDEVGVKRPVTYEIENGGKYLVLAGAFEYKHNAENLAGRLRGLGYDEAVTKIFDKGKLAVVLVNRFDTYSQAIELSKNLKKEHNVEAYVQSKRD